MGTEGGKILAGGGVRERVVFKFLFGGRGRVLMAARGCVCQILLVPPLSMYAPGYLKKILFPRIALFSLQLLD